MQGNKSKPVIYINGVDDTVTVVPFLNTTESIASIQRMLYSYVMGSIFRHSFQKRIFLGFLLKELSEWMGFNGRGEVESLHFICRPVTKCKGGWLESVNAQLNPSALAST